jgi:hypothetical protein
MTLVAAKALCALKLPACHSPTPHGQWPAGREYLVH